MLILCLFLWRSSCVESFYVLIDDLNVDIFLYIKNNLCSALFVFL